MPVNHLIQIFIDGIPWEIVITVFLTIIGSASPIAAYQYYRRPKPVTGVLPLDEISCGHLDLEELGDPSPGDEIRFSSGAFANEVNSLDDIGSSERFKNNTRNFFKTDGEILIPILIQNHGERDMREYKATITMHVETGFDAVDNEIQIRDVHTETLEIDGLFCHPDSFRGAHSDKIPNQKIIDMYHELGLPGHFVSLNGSLGSGTMEAIVMELWCPPTLSSFYLVIGIDSPDWFVGEKLFCQRIQVATETTP